MQGVNGFRLCIVPSKLQHWQEKGFSDFRYDMCTVSMLEKISHKDIRICSCFSIPLRNSNLALLWLCSVSVLVNVCHVHVGNQSWMLPN